MSTPDPENTTPQRGLSPLLWIIAVAATLTLTALNLYWGEVNQDEGWYLYAARLVAEGRQPYVDFASTQGPVMSYVYAMANPLMTKWGVAGGRLFTAGLGLATVCLAAWLARRAAGGTAAFVAFCLVGINVYQSYFFTVVKTYALAALFVVAGFLLLSFVKGKRGQVAALCAGVLFALAAGVRLSAGAILPVVFLCLLFARNIRAAVWLAIGATATLCAVFGPFLLTAPRALYFGLIEYHAGRKPGSLLTLLAYKGGFVSRVAQAYLVSIAILLVTVVSRCRSQKAGQWTLWLSVVAVTAVHFVAPFPYDDYQVIVYPLFAVAVAGLVQAFDRRHVSGLVLVLCLLSAGSSPMLQGWFVAGRDRIWWPLREESSLARLQRAGKLIREMSTPGDELLTMDPYLAIESGLKVPRGLEMGPFSYFADYPTEKANALNILNRDKMTALLHSTPAPLAALSDWAFAISSPSLQELPPAEQHRLRSLIDDRYRCVETIDNFGQADTALRVYRFGVE